MSLNLCDETFPSSLLIEFDELDDEIPISPELPKRHPQGAFPRHHSTLAGGPAIESVPDKVHADGRNRSRTVISGSSNTSSGHSSLSTEGENRSASSDRDTSRDLSKRQMPPNVSHDVDQRSSLPPLGDNLTLKLRKYRPPRSMESLLQEHTAEQSSRMLRTLTPSQQGTGLGMGAYGSEGGSSGNISGGAGTKQYHRNRTKYGHVQSKVKQLIDEMKPSNNRDRKTLVRHKSMPDTFEPDARDEDDESLEQETNIDALKAIIREMKVRTSSLEQQLNLRDVSNTNVSNELATLKCKNSALRMENDQLLEQDRVREQRRQVLRQCDHHPGSCYGSQSSLHKASQNIHTVGTQTSPRGDAFSASFEVLSSPDRPTPSPLKRSSLSAGRKAGRPVVVEHTASFAIETEPMLGEFSPDYEQLIPMLGRSGDSSSFGRDLRFREPRPSPIRAAVERSDTELASANGTTPSCRDCRKRMKKTRKTRKLKLSSLFCIRRHDESL